MNVKQSEARNMANRKQRINVMLEESTVEELEKQYPEKQRSDFIEQQVRRGLGMPEAEGQKGFAVYERSIDDGFGSQIVYVKDGRIVHQYLSARQGHYTGDGNPEWIGQKVNVLYGNGFKKLRSAARIQEIEMEWLQEEVLEP